jgi:HNH endonuclease
MARNYRKEYDNYQGTEEQKKRRAKRNAARDKLKKAGRVSKGDGKDVHHKNGNPHNNSSGNLAVTSKSNNRSFPRNKNAGKK